MSLTIITKIFNETKQLISNWANCIMYLDPAKVSESEQLDFQFEIEN